MEKQKKECKNSKIEEIQDIYQNKIDRAYFEHNKLLHCKAFNIAKLPKYVWHQRGLASIFYKFFDKNSTAPANKSSAATRAKKIATHIGTKTYSNSENQQLVEELKKPNIRKFEKVKYVLPLKTTSGEQI